MWILSILLILGPCYSNAQTVADCVDGSNVIVQYFGWKWIDIERECNASSNSLMCAIQVEQEQVIHHFSIRCLFIIFDIILYFLFSIRHSSFQVPPPFEHEKITLAEGSDPWYQRWSIIGYYYRVTDSGMDVEFDSMVKNCNANGIR